jgi:hypothetical protein
MLLLLLLGLAAWTFLSVPLALLLVRILDLEEGAPEMAGTEDELLLADTHASAPGHVQLERMDLALAVGAGLDRPRGADQVPRAGKRVRA